MISEGSNGVLPSLLLLRRRSGVPRALFRWLERRAALILSWNREVLSGIILVRGVVGRLETEEWLLLLSSFWLLRIVRLGGRDRGAS